MSKQLISIVIPTYNRDAFIRETIQSVLDQTVEHFEIIVVDDGSTDNTGNIVRGMRDSRIQYHWFQKQGCPAFPRNRGIELSKGDYIAFLDSDDLWLPNHLELCIRALGENQKVGGVFTDYYKLYDGNKLIHQRMAKSRYGNFTLKEMVANFSSIGAASNVVVRKDVFNDVGYFDETKEMAGSEDWQMWVRIAAKFKFVVVPIATVKLRVHGQNITLNPAKIELSIKTALGSVFSIPTLRPKILPYFNQAYAEVNTLAAINYYASGDMKNARNRLKEALLFKPLHITDRRFTWTFLRTLLGKKISRRLREMKWHFESSLHG